MPHYIRFLKPPKVVAALKTGCFVETLITITTDLGDAFLAEDAGLLSILQITDNNGLIIESFEETSSWTAGNRELKISFGPCQLAAAAHAARLSVRDASGGIVDRLEPSKAPSIVTAWSTSFGIAAGLQAEKLVERCFKLEIGPHLKAWEETGNSIARHIWDAALGCVMEIQNAYMRLDGSIPTLQKLFYEQKDTSLRVIELGTGCGIVGISIAQIVPHCSVLLTDLEEVHDIINRNLECATLARMSKAQFWVLDWDEQVPKQIAHHGCDLIVVSDCTYNADSLPALVQILTALVRISPSAIVLVALKKRHDSEEVFFDLMKKAEFEIDSHTVVPLPTLDAENESIDIELYAFRKDPPVDS
ncbi:hypothetical protein AJ79_02894 [Helicocarpus griseus UAMH5409]|uniref:Methyltransferase-domain-containing protein n=1 Tax=Helicocarpus griseus UAMH5409 TaxID=1447875 RepID=A0A2B7Y1P0_9EURO|nr:hypothetical protein AJ79_02894 [Helicocarpus griseus UAMH5409]